ncbi:MAG TPA: ADP-ribosylation factor-like protein [Polyangiaceae bacterium]
MPTFDPLLRRLVVRIVYDGPGTAGKTTNVQQICRMFPVTKRTELVTPGALKGRTMFFDWLEVDLATRGKIPVRAQVLSVTGQETRSYRRRPLLRSADAVVFVCDSRPQHLDNNRQRLLLLQRYLRERNLPAPYLIQANKQDLTDAIPHSEMLKHLRWKAVVPVFSAVASQANGVAETFQAAARAATRYAQSVIAADGISSVAGTPETADAVLDNLLALEDQVSEIGEADAPPASACEARDLVGPV